jgi:hypothetical protein
MNDVTPQSPKNRKIGENNNSANRKRGKKEKNNNDHTNG